MQATESERHSQADAVNNPLTDPKTPRGESMASLSHDVEVGCR